MTLDLRTYSIADFADEYLGSEPGVNLVEAGPAAAEVAQWTDAETYASPLIATVLWRAFLAGDGLREFQAAYPDQVPGGPEAMRDVFVVRHPLRGGEPRHDLMLFVAGDVAPRGITVEQHEALITRGWEKLRPELEEEAQAGSPVGGFAHSSEPLVEASAVQQYSILIAKVPEMIRSAYPSPAVDVRGSAEDEDFSTVGLLVEHVDSGAMGVTVALHAIENAGRGQVGAEVSIGGRGGFVRSIDAITDSCFVELENVGVPGVEPITGAATKGVLAGLTPRNYAEALFEGRGSGVQHTFVTGWSPEIPLVTRRMQLRVLTEPDTVPGDSGAALVDSDGYVLGFAFERTGYNERPPFASWIWGDSVMRAHNLKPAGGD